MSSDRYSPANERLRTILKKARKARGITQGALAIEIGVPQSWVSKVESGERLLSFVEVIKVCDVLGVDPVSLIKEIRDETRARLSKAS